MEVRRHHSIFWPLLLIALGIFLFLNTLGYIRGDMGAMLLRLWPLLFVVGGLDSIYRRESFVAPVLLLGVGVILLLNNFGYLHLGSWTLFLRLWPVLLIAWGLDLLIGRRSAWSPMLGILLGLGLIAAIVWFANAQPRIGASPHVSPVSQELQGVNRAAVDIHSITGSMQVASGAGAGQLIEGEVRLPVKTSLNGFYRVTGDLGRYSLNASDATLAAPFFSMQDYNWDLALTDSIPLDLEITQVVGEQRTDLSGLKVQQLDSQTVLGQNVVTLPASGSFSGKAGVVMGELVIRVPQGTAVNLRLETGLVNLSLPDDLHREDDRIILPGDGAPIHIIASIPIGSLKVEYTP